MQPTAQGRGTSVSDRLYQSARLRLYQQMTSMTTRWTNSILDGLTSPRGLPPVTDLQVTITMTTTTWKARSMTVMMRSIAKKTR